MVQECLAKQPSVIVNEEEILITKRETIHRAEVDTLKRDFDKNKEASEYKRNHYTVSSLSENVVRMETGLPTKDIFNIVVNYVNRFKASISYYSRWKVEIISLEDQIFITLMKLRQNYTNLHLAQLFSCSVGTISNIVTTFIHVLHSLLFVNIMTSIPSRGKKQALCPLIIFPVHKLQNCDRLHRYRGGHARFNESTKCYILKLQGHEFV